MTSNPDEVILTLFPAIGLILTLLEIVLFTIEVLTEGVLEEVYVFDAGVGGNETDRPFGPKINPLFKTPGSSTTSDLI